MSQLIAVQQVQSNRGTVQTVNARELHQFLGSNQDFTTWIKARIQKYGFVEGDDFTLHKTVERRVTKAEYHVTVDMAKELAMVERNEKGKQARLYFIECERKAKATPPALDLNNPASLRAALLGYTENPICPVLDRSTRMPSMRPPGKRKTDQARAHKDARGGP